MHVSTMVSTGVAEGADGVDMDVADGDGEPLLAALRAASRVANTSATIRHRHRQSVSPYDGVSHQRHCQICHRR